MSSPRSMIERDIAVHLQMHCHVDHPPAFLTTEQVSLLTAITAKSLANQRTRGTNTFPYIRTGKKVLYPLSGVIDYMVENYQQIRS